MPRISEFFGIVIEMYYGDHPPPHFHARYSGQMASIEIEALLISEGGLPPAQLSKVMKWASLHRLELLENWELASLDLPLKRIDPLT